MYYEITGEGDPLVLINGLGLAVSETGRLVDALARQYRVLAFDNRGAGQTDKPDQPLCRGRASSRSRAVTSSR
jgi:pimeloyl-ACP methyl ester carboxylesterase